MKCTNCGVDTPDNFRFCAACGTRLPTIHYGTLVLSAKEAKHGCQKDFFMPGMIAPIRFCIQPKIKDNQVLLVNNASFYDAGGNAGIEPLKIVVKVQKKKSKWWIPLAAAVMVLFLIGIALRIGDWMENKTGTQVINVPEARELIPNFELKYFLNALDDTQLQTVCLLYQSVMDFEEYCVMPDGVYEEDIVTLLPLLEAECPELLQVDFRKNIEYYFDRATNEITKVKIPYCLDQETYEDMRRKCDAVIQDMVSKTAGLSDADKEKYVFDRIASSCWYNMDAKYAGTAYGALVDGKAKCDGISLAMKWAMETMGIQCLCVTADCPGETVGHAWNIIQLNGKYYTLDLTMSVRNTTYIDAGIEDIIYFQYNVSDAWAEDRYVIHDYLADTAPIPKCNSNEDSYYARNNCFVHTNADPKGYLYAALKASARGGGKVYFQFEKEAEQAAFFANIQSAAEEWFRQQPQQYTSLRWNKLSFGVVMIEVVK